MSSSVKCFQAPWQILFTLSSRRQDRSMRREFVYTEYEDVASRWFPSIFSARWDNRQWHSSQFTNTQPICFIPVRERDSLKLWLPTPFCLPSKNTTLLRLKLGKLSERTTLDRSIDNLSSFAYKSTFGIKKVKIRRRISNPLDSVGASLLIFTSFFQPNHATGPPLDPLLLRS